MHIYIYIYIERERERERNTYVCIYIYIYLFISELLLISSLMEIKNGCCFDKRYKGQMLTFDRPRVFMFTNTLPEWTLLSQDRWDTYIYGKYEGAGAFSGVVEMGPRFLCHL